MCKHILSHAGGSHINICVYTYQCTYRKPAWQVTCTYTDVTANKGLRHMRIYISLYIYLAGHVHVHGRDSKRGPAHCCPRQPQRRSARGEAGRSSKPAGLAPSEAGRSVQRARAARGGRDDAGRREQHTRHARTKQERGERLSQRLRPRCHAAVTATSRSIGQI